MYRKDINFFLSNPLTFFRAKGAKGKKMLPLVLANLYWPALAGTLVQRFQMTILNFLLKLPVLFDIDHLIPFLMS